MPRVLGLGVTVQIFFCGEKDIGFGKKAKVVVKTWILWAEKNTFSTEPVMKGTFNSVGFCNIPALKTRSLSSVNRAQSLQKYCII